jgi:hypothetical protein
LRRRARPRLRADRTPQPRRHDAARNPGPLQRPSASIDPTAEAILRQAQPRIQPFQDDLSGTTEAALLARGMTPLATLTLLALRFLPGQAAADTVATIDRWGPLLHAVDTADGPPVGGEAIEQFGWYVLHVTEASPIDVHMAIQRHRQRPEETIMSTAERLRREGMEKGMATGDRHGRAATLQRLPARRFGPLPPTIESRLRDATVADLERWADRILDAGTLDEVLADG